MQNMTDPNELPSGADIYDSNGQPVGMLDTWRAQEGYLAVFKGIFTQEVILLPVSVVDHASVDGIHLNRSLDELRNGQYEQPSSQDEAQTSHDTNPLP